MAKIIYMQDRTNGTHIYYPEMSDRKPDTQFEARLSHDGRHYIVDTPFELKGRGISPREVFWVDGCRQQLENWKSYRVTEAAYKKLEAQYPIAIPCYLD